MTATAEKFLITNESEFEVAGLYVLRMDGSNGRRKATRNSPTSFTAMTASRFLWHRS
jgi:hypothetical protein